MVKAECWDRQVYYSGPTCSCQYIGNGGFMATGRFAETVRSALIGELEELRDEVRKLADGLNDTQLWQRPFEPSNSVGHLILHLTGNINHFVGAQLGNTGYVREREREFTETDAPPRDQLMRQLDDAVAIFRHVVSGLTEVQLMATHPSERLWHCSQGAHACRGPLRSPSRADVVHRPSGDWQIVSGDW